MSLTSIPNMPLKIIAYYLIADPKDLVNFGKACKKTNNIAKDITENESFLHLKSLYKKRYEMRKYHSVDPIENLKRPIRNYGVQQLDDTSSLTNEMQAESSINDQIQTEVRKVTQEFMKKK